jgi:hypothetical protein
MRARPEAARSGANRGTLADASTTPTARAARAAAVIPAAPVAPVARVSWAALVAWVTLTAAAVAPAEQAVQAAPAAPAAAAAAALELPALMALLAQRKSGQARFTEERVVAGFDGPLRSSGLLSFSAPDRFARHTLEPLAESMELDGRQLTLRRGGRIQRLAVDAMPELAALLEAVRGTLAGDAAALQRHFRVQVAGSAELWRLRLAPIDPTLASQVRTLQIAGQGADMRSIEMHLAGGDRSLMLIEPLPPAAAAASR